MININDDWKKILQDEFEKEYFINLINFIDNEYSNNHKIVFPQYDDIFNALNLCSHDETKVVILGQDPYHEVNQAMGLAFSVKEGVKIPPSLKNIFKEMYKDEISLIPSSGDLTYLAKQGVLLLNAVLTVEQGKAASHKNKGWEKFTDHIIETLNKKNSPVVFILWGNYAKEKQKLITNPRHLVLSSAHPSPLSAYNGFFGNNHFNLANQFLTKNNLSAIDWIKNC